MMTKLTRAPGNEEIIREFRREICQRIGIDPNGAGSDPLAHAFYLFAYTDEEINPAGMVEFFFYDDAFASFSDSVYSQAYDLSRIADMSEMIHVRSVIIQEAYHHSRLFMHLLTTLLATAWDLGAAYMTASTSTKYEYILGLHKNAGMTRLGTFVTDGSPQQLSLLKLAPVAARAKRLCLRAESYTDHNAQEAIALRTCRMQSSRTFIMEAMRERRAMGLATR